jgi:hypothetical protein
MTAANRTARTAVRTDAPASEPVREPVRAKVRTRKNIGAQSQFHVPPEWIPEGMDFQWNVDSVLGKPETHQRMMMEQQAWEPVDPSKEPFTHLDGKFARAGHKGEICVDGLVLMWRPLELTLEARAEELQAARYARHVEEAKMAAGRPDGVNPNMLDPNHGSAPRQTFFRKSHERIPSMPVQD